MADTNFLSEPTFKNLKTRVLESDTEDEFELLTTAKRAKPDNSARTRGFVYCIAPARNDVNLMKVGYWTGTLPNLFRRYATYYGEDLQLHVNKVDNCRLHEQKILSKFSPFKLSGELFDRTHWPQIVAAIDHIEMS